MKEESDDESSHSRARIANAFYGRRAKIALLVRRAFTVYCFPLEILVLALLLRKHRRHAS
jgi:hypothetical protein